MRAACPDTEPSRPPDEENPSTTPTAFELVKDLVRAERNAEPSDKWYGDWDDTHTQRTALDAEHARYQHMTRDAVESEYLQFQSDTAQHLHECPLIEGREPLEPDIHLGPLREHVTETLREKAAALRAGDGRALGLTKTATETLARLYETHAELGEALWDEHGGTWAPTTGLPGY